MKMAFSHMPRNAGFKREAKNLLSEACLSEEIHKGAT
jgi:hypothetical protein